jgi:hypothetical protein
MLLLRCSYKLGCLPGSYTTPLQLANCPALARPCPTLARPCPVLPRSWWTFSPWRHTSQQQPEPRHLLSRASLLSPACWRHTVPKAAEQQLQRSSARGSPALSAHSSSSSSSCAPVIL